MTRHYPTTVNFPSPSRSVPVALAAALLLVAVTCGGDEAGNRSAPVQTGAVVAVDARSLTDIESFTLRTDAGETEIFIDEGRDYSESGFLPQHLREHVITGVQVRVEVERQGDRLVATGMRDA